MGHVFASLFIGGTAGWLVGMVMKSKREKVLINVLIGVISGALGGWLLSPLG